MQNGWHFKENGMTWFNYYYFEKIQIRLLGKYQNTIRGLLLQGGKNSHLTEI